ncbi:MAG: phage tail tip lysozyme [Candidatus Binatia bacterium]
MATVIDSLLVTLGLDPSGFRRGTDEAIRAQDELTEQTRRQNTALDEQEKKNAAAQRARAQEIQARAKSTAEAFAKIRNQALSMLAVFTAGKGLSSFTSDTVKSTAALSRMAENVGIGTDTLLAFQLAAKNAGGSAEGMMAQIQKTANSAASVAMGRPDDAFTAFLVHGGGNYLKDDKPDAMSLLLAQADALKAKREMFGEQQAMIAAQDMGISMPEYNFLKQGSAAVKQQIEEAKKHTRVTQDQIDASIKFSKQWNNLSADFDTVGKSILFKFMPIMEKLFEKLSQFAEWLKTVDVKKFADGVSEVISDVFEKLTEVIPQVYADFKKLIDWLSSVFPKDAKNVFEQLGGWKTVLEGIIALKIVSMVAPILGLAGAFTALATPLLIIAGIAAAGFAIDQLVPQNMKDMVEGWIAKGAAFMGYDEAQDEVEKRTGKKKEDQKTFRDYIPEWGNEALAAFGDKKAQQAANSQKAMEFFQSQGWTEEQSRGIVANLLQESNLNPNAVGDSGLAYGIAQWHKDKDRNKDRQADFKAWAGKDIRESTLMEQLAFVDFELRRGKEQYAGKKIKAAVTDEDAAAATREFYERPLNKYGDEDAKRIAIARGLRQKPDSAQAQNPARQAINGRNEYNSTVNHTRSNTSQSVHSETHVGKVEIHTAATDSNGIASTIVPAIERKTQVFLGSSGMW